MFYENRSLVVRIVKIVFLLFFIAAGPLQALDSDDSSGSVKVKKSLRKRVVNSLSSKKTQPKVEESNEYRALKANLELHFQQISWLQDFVTSEETVGLFLRGKEKAKHKFFNSLNTLYRIELENLLLLTLGEEADVQLFPGLSNAMPEMPDFKKAFGQFFDSLELVLEQAKKKIDSTRSCYDKFSEEFKRGKAEATTGMDNEEETDSVKGRLITVVHVCGMIHDAYSQYHFFSKVLPLLRVYFEEQLFMGQKVELFNIIKEKSKEKDEKSGLFSLKRQVKLRERMDPLLDDHLSVIASLNPILSAHGEKPICYAPHLYEARIAIGKTLYSVRKIITEHKNEPWGEKLAREVESVELEAYGLFHLTKALLTNPDSDNIRWKVPSSSPSASPETLLKRERSERKSSGAKLEWFKRTLSKATLKDNGEESERHKQDVAPKKQPLSAKHRKNKKNSKE